ncbi:ABC transporter substrate-binding protein [Bacillaceae bacterium SAS-127]|nr:ABC transporter substrate-binding protein [Bacillaceae bacterium SAS-127]
MAVIASGCQNASSDDKPKSEASKPQTEELIIGSREIVADLDPTVPIVADYLVNLGAGELLFKANEKGDIQPSLAKSIEQVDATTWNITLRPDVKFWSGKSVNADAVISSLERSRKLDVKAQPFLEGINFSKESDTLIKVKTSQPNMTVPLNLSYFQLVIHNTEARFDSVENMDLTGMYKVIDYKANQKMVLEINENYWGQKPTIPRVLHEAISDDQSRVLAAQSGRYHVVMNIPVSNVKEFENSDVATISAEPAANSETVYFNLKQPQFQDIRVRQALSWGLDREELVILGAEGYSSPLTTWIGSNPSYSDAKNMVYNKYDPKKAATLLDEAGWKVGSDGIRQKDGKPLSIRLMTWGIDKALGEAIQNQWSKIGVKAEVSHGDYSLIQTARDKEDWDAFIEAWSTFGDVTALLKGQYAKDGGGNYGGYNDTKTNDLFTQIDQAQTAEERYELVMKLTEHVTKQAPVICVYPRPELTAVNKSLDGFTPHFRQFENIVNSNLMISAK